MKRAGDWPRGIGSCRGTSIQSLMVKHLHVPRHGKNPPQLLPVHPQNARRGPGLLHATPCHAAKQKTPADASAAAQTGGDRSAPHPWGRCWVGVPLLPSSHPQLPAASHLLGVLAVLSTAARNIAMKFPVCVSPAAAAGLLRACGRLRGGELPVAAPATMEVTSPRPGLLLAALCLLASHGKLQLALLSSPLLLARRNSPRRGTAFTQLGLCLDTRSPGLLGGSLLSHPVISERVGDQTSVSHDAGCVGGKGPRGSRCFKTLGLGFSLLPSL